MSNFLGAHHLLYVVVQLLVVLQCSHGIVWNNYEKGEQEQQQQREASVSVLGDSIISQKAADSMFLMLDGNDNGGVTAEEIRAFVSSTGGSDLDDQGEIGSAAASVMHSMDDNADQIVGRKDLRDFLMRQGESS